MLVNSVDKTDNVIFNFGIGKAFITILSFRHNMQKANITFSRLTMWQNKTHVLLVTWDLFWLGNVNWVNNCDHINNVGKYGYRNSENEYQNNKTIKNSKTLHYCIQQNINTLGQTESSNKNKALTTIN